MIEAKGLYHRYGKNCDFILTDLNFTIKRGEFVFIVGPSGAGKSTLLKLLIREIVPSEGTISIFGQDLGTMPQRQIPFLRRNIGMVFQDFRLLEDRTAFDNVAFALRVTGASSGEITRRTSMSWIWLGWGLKHMPGCAIYRESSSASAWPGHCQPPRFNHCR